MQALYNCEVLFDCFSKPTNGGKKNKHCRAFSKWLLCMNIKIGSCHANLILLQAKPVSCVLIVDFFFTFLGGRRKLENRHSTNIILPNLIIVSVAFLLILACFMLEQSIWDQ